MHPWDRGQGFPPRRSAVETERLHGFFTEWLRIGPRRRIADLEQITGWSEETCKQKASRFRWWERARLYDLHAGPEPFPEAVDAAVGAMVPNRLPNEARVPLTVSAGALREFQQRARAAAAQHEAELADYRERMRELGRLQSRAARNLLVTASAALARHHALAAMPEGQRAQQEKPYFSILRMNQVFATANSLAAAGAELEGRALAVDQLIQQVQSISQVGQWIIEAGQVSEAELLEVLPIEALQEPDEATAAAANWDAPAEEPRP